MTLKADLISEATARLREIEQQGSTLTASVNIDDLRLLLEANAAATEAAHHVQLLGQALGECIEAAGITRPGASLAGPQLLMFAQDLKFHLESTRQNKADLASGMQWKVRERRHADDTLLGCFVEAPAVAEIAYGLEVLGDDYTGYGEEEGKLAHCNMIVALANSAGGVRDDLTVEGAEAQYEEAAKALMRATERQYSVNSTIEVKVGKNLITGEVTGHSDCWWSRPGLFLIRNIATGKVREVSHYHVKMAQASR